jgi:hypothetical protein
VRTLLLASSSLDSLGIQNRLLCSVISSSPSCHLPQLLSSTFLSIPLEHRSLITVLSNATLRHFMPRRRHGNNADSDTGFSAEHYKRIEKELDILTSPNKSISRAASGFRNRSRAFGTSEEAWFLHLQRLYGLTNFNGRILRFHKRDPVKTLHAISININYIFFERLFIFRKDRIGGSASCRPTRLYFSSYERRRLAVWRSIHSSKLRCIEYAAARSSSVISVHKFQVQQQLAINHGRMRKRKRKRKTPVIRAEDEFEPLRTMYLSVEMTFDRERHLV